MPTAKISDAWKDENAAWARFIVTDDDEESPELDYVVMTPLVSDRKRKTDEQIKADLTEAARTKHAASGVVAKPVKWDLGSEEVSL